MGNHNTRPLEKSEEFVTCPKCAAPAGSPCTLAWCNEPGISAVAHVERKRAAGRRWRVEQAYPAKTGGR